MLVVLKTLIFFCLKKEASQNKQANNQTYGMQLIIVVE